MEVLFISNLEDSKIKTKVIEACKNLGLVLSILRFKEYSFSRILEGKYNVMIFDLDNVGKDVMDLYDKIKNSEVNVPMLTFGEKVVPFKNSMSYSIPYDVDTSKLSELILKSINFDKMIKQALYEKGPIDNDQDASDTDHSDMILNLVTQARIANPGVYYGQRDPELVLKMAAETLGVQNLGLIPDDIDFDKISVDVCWELCSLLYLNIDTILMGYNRTFHIGRIQAALEESPYHLPKTPEARAIFKEIRKRKWDNFKSTWKLYGKRLRFRLVRDTLKNEFRLVFRDFKKSLKSFIKGVIQRITLKKRDDLFDYKKLYSSQTELKELS